MTPIYFCISDTSNSLAVGSRSFVKLSMLEDFRANVLKLNDVVNTQEKLITQTKSFSINSAELDNAM